TAAALGAYLLAAGLLRPVERMRARAAAITAGEADGLLPVPAAEDEISRLGRTFNALLASLRESLQRERRFVADASHDLRTPLSLLTTELELALRRPRSAEELSDALSSALEETGRLSRLAEDLLLLSSADRPTEPTPEATELLPVLDAVADRYRSHTGGEGVVLDCPPGLSVLASRSDLDRAVGNLVENALRHGATPVAIHARPVPASPGPVTVIEVRDHGPGFEEEFLPRAFDRFAKADPARSRDGAGLGLGIAAALAERNNGTATAANHPDGGAVLTLTLPAAQAFP
uniref:HAMP domain-containing sensor histidine kinase n=1 Tax=Sinomonas sp. G460-2 TaxID=3393464 RepID=UPI0039EFF2B3